MSPGSPDESGHVIPAGANANREPGDTSAGRLGWSVGTIDVGEEMADMERMFRANGNQTQQLEALTTLRRWQFDPMLNDTSRERARELVWQFQPNGWDEV